MHKVGRYHWLPFLAGSPIRRDFRQDEGILSRFIACSEVANIIDEQQQTVTSASTVVRR